MISSQNNRQLSKWKKNLYCRFPQVFTQSPMWLKAVSLISNCYCGSSNSISKKLDYYQRIQKAGFRSSFSIQIIICRWFEVQVHCNDSIRIRKRNIIVRLHENTDKFKIEREVRQVDNISPKLFITILESILKKLSQMTSYW